jgi:deferrochelatase/peroxidase EfeB
LAAPFKSKSRLEAENAALRHQLIVMRHQAKRETVFGVNSKTGLRVDKTTGRKHLNTASTSHAPKINPKRIDPDLFGMMDESRRFLRRPYFFNDGLDSDGEEIRGLHHISFARNLGVQYEWPVQMWQMNPDFPKPGTGRDALYDLGGAENISAGYYFIPPAASARSYIGARLLD